MEKVRVLFVCLGNICRSPMAEGAFRFHVENAGLSDKIVIDSAGTAAYHVGNLADERMRQVAASRGLVLSSKARHIAVSDVEAFDYILAMDRQNFRDISDLTDHMLANLYLMREFDDQKLQDDVPDPYYGGIDGFEEVYQMLMRSTKQLLEVIVREQKL